MKVRYYLFKNMDGCSNHDCIVSKRSGMGTNGSCGCIMNMNRSQLMILKSRLSVIIDMEVVDNAKDST